MKRNPIARNKNIVVQDLETEVLIYDLNLNKAYCLNQISGLVWQFCDGRNSVSDINRLISCELKMKVPEELIWLALDLLKKDDLLERNPEFEINYGGLTRREIVKKVGLATMIALPLISSILAPPAVQAQSGGPTNLTINSPCNSNGQCQSGTCAFVTTASLLFTNRCCLSSPALGPGFILAACATPSDCAAQASSCCTGMTTSAPSCPGAPSCLCG